MANYKKRAKKPKSHNNLKKKDSSLNQNNLKSNNRIFFHMISIAFVFLVLGWFLGHSMNTLNSEKIALLLKSTSTNFDLLNLQFSFFYSSLSNCSVSGNLISQLSDQVSKLGQILEHFDEKGIKNKYYYLLKERYHLYQIKLYLLYKTYLDHCDASDDVILFFWGLNNESKLQGKQLDKLVSNYPKLHIFAVQKGYAKAYSFLEDYYNINSTPFLVINYDHIFENLTDANQIQIYLKGYKLKQKFNH